MMPEALELFDLPTSDEMYMIAGWRQWADAGSISSGLPDYLVKNSGAQPLGEIHTDGFYLFQIPGTHHLVRPIVKFEQGYPEAFAGQSNQFFYTENSQRGVVLFIGDEPHVDAERYVRTLLEAAKRLKVRRIIGLGGVYGMVPYEKERMISCNYSLPWMKQEMSSLAVSLTDYHGGASIGSYMCRRAGEIGIEYVGMYGFVPLYDLSGSMQANKTVRVENDYMAWLGILRRINYMLKVNFNLTDLSMRAALLARGIRSRLDEIARETPQTDVNEYVRKLSEEFVEQPFIPLDDVWEENLKQIFDKFDENSDEQEES
jgi:proteasome assembly chaperone (PAC2) family protein